MFAKEVDLVLLTESTCFNLFQLPVWQLEELAFEVSSKTCGCSTGSSEVVSTSENRCLLVQLVGRQPTLTCRGKDIVYIPILLWSTKLQN